jgi:hypothetical protein
MSSGLTSRRVQLEARRAVPRLDADTYATAFLDALRSPSPCYSAPSDHAALERALDAVRAELPEVTRFEKLSMARRIDELLARTRPRGGRRMVRPPSRAA